MGTITSGTLRFSFFQLCLDFENPQLDPQIWDYFHAIRLGWPIPFVFLMSSLQRFLHHEFTRSGDLEKQQFEKNNA